MNYHLKAIILKDCPYSTLADSLIKNHKIPAEIININWNNKDKYITNEIDTFPQIYLTKKNSKGTQLLGGYTDLKYFFDTFKNQPINNNVDEFMKKYNWSRKGTLRLIQLINFK